MITKNTARILAVTAVTISVSMSAFASGEKAAETIQAADAGVIDAGVAAKKFIDVQPDSEWKPLTFYSGDVNYYSIREEDGVKVIHAEYKDGLDTVILHRKLNKSGRYSRIEWKWHAVKFPEGGDENNAAKNDSVASVYVFFKSGVRKFVLKYVWSAAAAKGYNYRRPGSNYFDKMQLIVCESPPNKPGEWRTESIDIASDFRKYFYDGDPNAEVPPVAGIGILTDGDQTHSTVIADYTGFKLIE